MRSCGNQPIKDCGPIRRGRAAWPGRFTALARCSLTPQDPADLQRGPAQCRLLARPLFRSPVPPWDFDVPAGPDRIDDSSAAAIAASGLWNLAELTAPHDPARANRYRDATLAILDTLCTDHYLAWSTPGWEGVLKHGVYHFHKKLGVDESVMWGEFFFLEAVDKVLRAPRRWTDSSATIPV